MSELFEVRILPQPDDTTCGPTCLQALYGFYGDEIPLERVIREIVPLDTHGTLAVLLARHALHRGYSATIYTYNLHVFDPTWFEEDRELLPARLKDQARVKNDPKLHVATDVYLDFLALGGNLRFQELTPELLRGFLEKRRPILTGLSATYLYGCPREQGERRIVYDDVRGLPTGHFVVLSGYDSDTAEVLVADPLGENPRFLLHYYRVGIQRLIGAILLGVLTYDANFLVVEPGVRSVPR
ncbi:MAG: hypothetical protein EXR92_01190 [Gemmatimonadetes bacterium]|nr:hypothetical protein [Gemmatimonadota bacterium]